MNARLRRPMNPIRPLTLRFALIVVALGSLTPAFGAVPSGSRPDLARQYLAVRSSVQEYLTVSALADAGALIEHPEAASAMKDAFLREARSGADWNPNNPQWKRMAAMIDDDIAQITNELASGADSSALSRQVDEAMIESISNHLSAEQLRALVRYYSSPSGRQFAAVQAQIARDLLAGSAAAMATKENGGKPTRSGHLDNVGIEEMQGLVDEYVRIQLGLLDPGDRGDRSGLQAIPTFFGMGIRMNFQSLEEKWHSIGERDRAAILAWRQAPLALAERQALWGAAKEVHRISDPGTAAQRFAQVLEKYRRKWAAELNY